MRQRVLRAHLQTLEQAREVAAALRLEMVHHAKDAQGIEASISASQG